MNTNKQIAYKIWLDELNTTPSEVFFPTFAQYFNLLIKENLAKIESLQKQDEQKQKKLARYRYKAVKELEGLLKRVEIEAKREKIQSLPEIDKYYQAKKGEILTTEALPDTLYHSIRLTIEKYWSKDKFRKIGNLMSVNGNIWYLDYDKVCRAYPSYKQFKDIEDAHNREYKEEPWGAFSYLRFAITFFKSVTPEQAGIFIKPDIINSLRRLVLYLSTSEAKKDKKRPTKFIGIENLFFLSRSPLAIYYEGSTKNKRAWISVKGKTQPYAILHLVAEKYKRRRLKGGNGSQQIRLSEVEVKECLTDYEKCDRQPNWKATILPKRRLKLLEKNIKSIVPFTDDELRVEEYNQTPFLVFRPKPKV